MIFLKHCSHNVEFKKVGGAPPELILIGKGGEELEVIKHTKKVMLFTTCLFKLCFSLTLKVKCYTKMIHNHLICY